MYLDDILIVSENESQHSSDLTNVLSILSRNNLRLTLHKCEFFKSSLTFLGYEISLTGIRSPTYRIDVIVAFQLPESSTDMRRFMCMLNFFRQIIPNFANIAFHLTELLRLQPKAKIISWTAEAKDSFEKLKQALASCPTLSFPSPGVAHYQLVTDASSQAVGGALYQMIDNTPHPIGFFPKKLSQTQRVLSTYDRELLASFLAVLHF